MAQLIKNLPAVWNTWVLSLGWEDPLGKEMATLSSILGEDSTDRGDWLQSVGCKESDTTELLTPSLHLARWLLLSLFYLDVFIFWLRGASRCCGFSCCGAQAAGARAPVFAAHLLRGVWGPDQGSNQCLRYCEADS